MRVLLEETSVGGGVLAKAAVAAMAYVNVSATGRLVASGTSTPGFTVAAEAGAMGRPVIATDHGGARETVMANVSGLLVPPGAQAALAGAIHKILDLGESGRAAMGERGRAHITERFSVERMCADTLALYRSLLAN